MKKFLPLSYMLFVLVAVLLAVLHNSATVDAKDYGSSGCGLGSMIIGDHPGMLQVLAATMNSSSGSQTFGITSGSSHCADVIHSPVTFIEVNQHLLRNNASAGSGEALETLGKIYGCQDLTQFLQLTKNHYGSIFNNSLDLDDAEKINARWIAVLVQTKLTCDILTL